ncbi:MAG: hypothetical protein GF372_06620 [Candidatus Marinimicrobia bacterium]|nr:hypothetical protein [Candidatus Neomarinimicrobiota bacterium]
MFKKQFSVVRFVVALSLAYTLFVFAGCKKFEDYLVLNNEKNGKVYTNTISVENGDVGLEVSGEYTYVWPNILLSIIGIRLINTGTDTLMMDSGEILLKSLHFDYEKEFSQRSFEIRPGAKEVFPFEFTATVTEDFENGEWPTLPENEKLTLAINGLRYKGLHLKVEEIQFGPEKSG